MVPHNSKSDLPLIWSFSRAYEPGTSCFDSILQALGSDLKGENGQIDRRKLGAKVFADPEMLRKLESIVWPEILRMAMEEMKRLDPTVEFILVYKYGMYVLISVGFDGVRSSILVY